MSTLGLAAYEEIDLLAPQTSVALRSWGSPTILVNGVDATGAQETLGDDLNVVELADAA